MRLGRSLGEAPPLQQPRARLVSPLPVWRLGASAKCLGTRSCSQGTTKVVTPGNFCTDYFCAWDSPARGLLAQRGRALPPRSASSPGWRAAARESRSCTRMSVPPRLPEAPTPPGPALCPSVNQQRCLAVNRLGTMRRGARVLASADPCLRLRQARRSATHTHTSFYMSFLSSWIKSRAAKLPVLCHVTLIASRSHHILNSCGFSEAIYLMQFAKCLRSSADSDILGLQSFAI